MLAAARPTIRRMTTADVEAATAALVRGDWGDRRDWWRFVTANAGCIPLVAEDASGIVATGVGTVHGRAGWVGTIFTVPERRREGIGLAISEAVCDALLGAGCTTLVLVATPAGRPVYEKLGFAETTWYRMFGRDGVEGGGDHRTELVRGTVVGPLSPADLPEVLALDAAVTGEDRAGTLRYCVGARPGLVARGPDGDLRGFGVRAPWHGAAVIAPEPDDALALLRARLVDAGPGRPVRAGILAGNEAGARALVDDGWTERWQAVRMERGEPLAWRPEAIWGQLGFAVG